LFLPRFHFPAVQNIVSGIPCVAFGIDIPSSPGVGRNLAPAGKAPLGKGSPGDRYPEANREYDADRTAGTKAKTLDTPAPILFCEPRRRMDSHYDALSALPGDAGVRCKGSRLTEPGARN
jgi:hypothetical protein